MNSWSRQLVNSRPEPATRSATVRETSTWPDCASAAIWAPICTATPPRSPARCAHSRISARVKGEEEFTLGVPDADGMIPVDGSGECVKGGTRAYKHAECTYTFTGTLDPTTNVVTFDITGTTSR